jgi:hypothetical protein
MGQASRELIQALDGLRKAAQTAFAGNDYYLVSSQINELLELIGWNGGNAGIPANDTVVGFDAALANVRKIAEHELSGNPYYLVSQKLNMLAVLSPGRATAKEAGRTFDDLAAAAKSRVDEVAESLNIDSGRSKAPGRAAFPETLADGGLERRSSEPCAMAELAPPLMEPVASAAISAKTAPARGDAEAAHGLGSPASEVERGFAHGAIPASPAKETDAKAALHPPASAHDSPSAAAGQAVAGGMQAGSKPKGKKTLFGLWLDVLFGRKD